MAATSPDSNLPCSLSRTQRAIGQRYLDPATWLSHAELRDGSWWLEWTDWLARNSSKQSMLPPEMGAPDRRLAPLDPAPGWYVRER